MIIDGPADQSTGYGGWWSGRHGHNPQLASSTRVELPEGIEKTWKFFDESQQLCDAKKLRRNIERGTKKEIAGSRHTSSINIGHQGSEGRGVLRMRPTTKFVSTFKRLSPSIAAVGAILMVIQNLLFLAGLALLVSGQVLAGALVSSSLYLDFAGIALMGMGLLVFVSTSANAPADRKAIKSHTRLGVASSVLCLVWVGLTMVWRVLGLGGLANAIDTANAFSSDSPEFAAAVSSLFTQVQIVMVVWITASVIFAFATILFAWYLHRISNGETGSIAWPFFGVINAVATILVAGSIFALAGGEVVFAQIVTSLFLKIVIVPIFGIVAYASLPRKLLRLARIREEATRPSQEIDSSERKPDVESKSV